MKHTLADLYKKQACLHLQSVYMAKRISHTLININRYRFLTHINKNKIKIKATKNLSHDREKNSPREANSKSGMVAPRYTPCRER